MQSNKQRRGCLFGIFGIISHNINMSNNKMEHTSYVITHHCENLLLSFDMLSFSVFHQPSTFRFLLRHKVPSVHYKLFNFTKSSLFRQKNVSRPFMLQLYHTILVVLSVFTADAFIFTCSVIIVHTSNMDESQVSFLVHLSGLPQNLHISWCLSSQFGRLCSS